MATSSKSVLDLAFEATDSKSYIAAAVKAGYQLKDKDGVLLTFKDGTPKVSKPALSDICERSDSAQQFTAVCEVCGQDVASLSANAPHDLYYDLYKSYREDGGLPDSAGTYMVLHAAWLASGRDQASYDAWAAERREQMGAGAADRLAAARAQAKEASAKKDKLIAMLAEKLGLSADDLATLA